MLQKTERSEISTNADHKAASFLTTKHRQMYKQAKKNALSQSRTLSCLPSPDLLPNDLLFFYPETISSLSWPQIFYIDGDTSASLKGSFYLIQGIRNHSLHVSRSSQSNAELVHFYAEKPGNIIFLTSVQRFFSRKDKSIHLHINLVKYYCEKEMHESSNFFISCEEEGKAEILDFQAFQIIEKAKKGVLVLKVVSNVPAELHKNNYKIVLLNLTSKNTPILTQLELDCEQTFGRENETFLKMIKSQFGDIILICTSKEIYELEIEEIGFDFRISLKPYKVSKIITSNKDHYMKKMQNTEKYLSLSEKLIGNSNSNQTGKSLTQKSLLYNKEEEIKDVQFMSNGLKIMILTTSDSIVIIEGHNFLLSENLCEILTSAQLDQRYNLDLFRHEKLYAVNGTVAVEFSSTKNQNLIKSKQQFLANLLDRSEEQKEEEKEEVLTKGLLILKLQNSGLFFSKMIHFQINMKDVLWLVLHECAGQDEVILQYIQKEQPDCLHTVKCHILMSQLNCMVNIAEVPLSFTKEINASISQQTSNAAIPADQHANSLSHASISLNHNIATTQNYLSNLNSSKVELTHFFHPVNEYYRRYCKAELARSGNVAYLLSEKELVCVRIFNEFINIDKAHKIHKLFTHSFFERPIKVVVSPLTMHFVILFKEFVKFFYFSHSTIKNYYSLKVKNIGDVAYSERGEKIIIATSEGNIFAIDAYTFREEKILEFYGEPTEVKLINEEFLIVKSIKNILFVYQKSNKPEEQFAKVFEIKLEETDQYCANSTNIVISKRNGIIEVYQYAQTHPQYDEELKSTHKHLANRKKCSSYSEDEHPTHILLSLELGFLFVSTSKGCVKQYIWPFEQPGMSSSTASTLSQQVSSCSILSMTINAKFTKMLVVCQDGLICEMELQQYINGEAMPHVYILADSKDPAINAQETVKREFTDRSYLIDDFTPIETGLQAATQQNYDELKFLVDKVKDDIEEANKVLSAKGKEILEGMKQRNKEEEKGVKEAIKAEEIKKREEIRNVKLIISNLEEESENSRKSIVEKHQKSLLQLYKEHARLVSIKEQQDIRLTNEKQRLSEQNALILRKLTAEKERELAELQVQYEKVELKRNQNRKEFNFLLNEEHQQIQQFKVFIHRQVEEELLTSEEEKERLLGSITRLQKQISNYKKRSNYFQNLILETKVQIGELTKDREEYERKKDYLKTELKDKEEIIERIEKELVEHLSNTEQMKKYKNTHEFELAEYEKEVNPISDNFLKIQNNVKSMNHEIMHEYNLKVEKTQSKEQAERVERSLKNRIKELTHRKLEIKTKLCRLIEGMSDILQNPFRDDLKPALLHLLEGEHRMATGKEEEQEIIRNERDKLLRYKNMVRKEIEEEEKRQEHIIKNQHEFYRYHIDNTMLVREFNDLKKTQKVLADEQHQLLLKLAKAKQGKQQANESMDNTTPLRRVQSIHLKKAHNLTPFQRYEQEQTPKKMQLPPTTIDTRASSQSQSVSFLKHLLKEVGDTESKAEKLEIMRERVRTFVNPEGKLKKTLFPQPQQRDRVVSEFMKLKL